MRYLETNSITLSQELLNAVDGLYSILNARDAEAYAAVHFLESFLDQWRRVQGVDEIVKSITTLGIDVDVEFAKSFPSMFLATTAYQLWRLDKRVLGEFISVHRRWFNLVVRDFKCPAVMKVYYKPIKWAYELNAEIIKQAVKEIRNSGWEPTSARIARKIGCHVSRIEKFLK